MGDAVGRDGLQEGRLRPAVLYVVGHDEGKLILHYHGTPITPNRVLHDLAGRNFCVSYAAPQQTKVCHEIGQSVMLDNGAFSVWKRGHVVDWDGWRNWVEEWLDYPNTWCVLPDSIGGSEADNDQMLIRYRYEKGVPVWHLHESYYRLVSLVDRYGKVCFGSSGEFATVGSVGWHRVVSEAFDRIVDQFGRVPWVHMLRGMSLCGDIYPFASVDSTDIARNHHLEHRNAKAMAERWDAIQCPGRWVNPEQLEIAV